MLIQINISDENSKSGITLAEVTELAAQVATMPNPGVTRPVTIPAPETDYERQCAAFHQMNEHLSN